MSGTVSARASFLVYPEARILLANSGLIGSARVVLLHESYIPSGEHRLWSDVEAHEVSGPGYTAGGKTTTVTTAQFQTLTRLRIASANLSWPGATFLVKYAAMLKPPPSGPLSDATMIGLTDLHPAGGSLMLRAGVLTLSWAGRTIINIRSRSV